MHRLVNNGGKGYGYCVLHYRIRGMKKRCSARYGQNVPMSWFEENWPKDMICRFEDCGKQMAMIGTQLNRGDVISIQHNQDGSMSFICQSCNSRDGARLRWVRHAENQKNLTLEN